MFSQHAGMQPLTAIRTDTACALRVRALCPTLRTPLLSSKHVTNSCWASSRTGARQVPVLLQQAPNRSAQPLCICKSATVDPVPEGLQIEVKPEDGTKEVDYDEVNKVVRIPLSALGSEGQRRSKLVLFTCNKCSARTARLVNPVAWEKGVVFGQCSKCKVWHVLASNNKKIFEEVRYKDDPEYQDIVPPEEETTDGEGQDAGKA